MKIRGIMFLCILAALVVFSSCENLFIPKDDTGIEYVTKNTLLSGQMSKRSISASKTDKWTFEAVKGDYIVVTVGDFTNDDFSPYIRLLSPSGQELVKDWGYKGASVSSSAPDTGKYTVEVQDNSSNNKGIYTISLFISGKDLTICSGDEGGTLANGATGTGIIGRGENDSWSFTAKKGDYITATIGDKNDNDFNPYIALISPTGVVLDYDWGYKGSEVSVNASETGSYSLVVRDNSSSNPGEYTLSLAVSGGGLTISSGDEGGDILKGETKSGTIAYGDLDPWTFTANAGNYITATIGDKNDNDFNPYIALISPTGVVLDYDWGYKGSEVSVNASETGSYSLVVRDNSSSNPGEYTLSLAVSGGGLTISSGDEGGDILKGETKSGTIAYGDLDPWTFTANAGDYIAATVGDKNNTDFNPYIALISPTGVVLDYDWGYKGSEVSAKATETGTYTLIIRDNSTSNPGEYTLSLAVSGGGLTITAGDEGGQINKGETKSGVITYGDLDPWTFSANTGATITASVSDKNNNDFNPYIALISPTGVVLDYDWGYKAAEVSAKATETGTYTLIIRDNSSSTPGEYTLVLN